MTIFFRWATPRVAPEGQADWDDDLAILYVEFGYSMLREAITHFRQQSDIRPTIPKLREHCRAIRERLKPATAEDMEMREFRRETKGSLLNPADNRFIPVCWVWRDLMEYRSLRAASRAKGHEPTPYERDQWWAQRNRRTEEEWRDYRQARIDRGAENPDAEPPEEATGLAPQRGMDFSRL